MGSRSMKAAAWTAPIREEEPQKAQEIRDAELLRRGIAAKERRDRKRGRGKGEGRKRRGLSQRSQRDAKGERGFKRKKEKGRSKKERGDEVIAAKERRDRKRGRGKGEGRKRRGLSQRSLRNAKRRFAPIRKSLRSRGKREGASRQLGSRFALEERGKREEGRERRLRRFLCVLWFLWLKIWGRKGGPGVRSRSRSRSRSRFWGFSVVCVWRRERRSLRSRGKREEGRGKREAPAALFCVFLWFLWLKIWGRKGGPGVRSRSRSRSRSRFWGFSVVCVWRRERRSLRSRGKREEGRGKREAPAALFVCFCGFCG